MKVIGWSSFDFDNFLINFVAKKSLLFRFIADHSDPEEFQMKSLGRGWGATVKVVGCNNVAQICITESKKIVFSWFQDIGNKSALSFTKVLNFVH